MYHEPRSLVGFDSKHWWYCQRRKLVHQRSAVVAIGCMLSGSLHPRFRNLNSTVPVDVVRVKSYVDNLLNSTRVPVRVSVNKLSFVQERIMPGLTVVFRNRRSLSSWEPYWTGTTLAKENFCRQIWGKVGEYTFLSEIMRWTRIFCLPSLVRSFRPSNWLFIIDKYSSVWYNNSEYFLKTSKISRWLQTTYFIVP